jgi:hypothetical protein
LDRCRKKAAEAGEISRVIESLMDNKKGGTLMPPFLFIGGGVVFIFK